MMMAEEKPLAINVIGVVQIVESGIMLVQSVWVGGMVGGMAATPWAAETMGSAFREIQFYHVLGLLSGAAGVWLGFAWIKLQRWAWFANLALWALRILVAATLSFSALLLAAVVNGLLLYFGTQEPVCRAFGTSLDEVKSFIASIGGRKETPKAP